jgi:hypothetical protein
MVALEGAGIASVMVASEEFVTAAQSQSDALGAEPKRVFVPHPIQDRTDEEMRRIADDAIEEILRHIVEEPTA